mgnify:CR=1 FL=1
MLAELVVIARRAAAARISLEALLDVVPGDYWDRRAEGELWSAYDHLVHLATIDEPMLELLEEANAGAATLRPYRAETAGEAMVRREALLAAATGDTVESLRARMEANRERVLELFDVLQPAALDASVIFPGVVNAWGQPVAVSLRHYLVSWAAHDTEHAEAIRKAITTPPSPGDLALAARRRRRR